MRHCRLPLLLMLLFATVAILAQEPAAAEAAAEAAADDQVTFSVQVDSPGFSNAVNIFLLFTFLAVAPTFIMMTTSFLRTVIVLAFLRQALGVQQSISGRTMSALALFLTVFIMQPVWTQVYQDAVKPYVAKEIDQEAAIMNASAPLKSFMLKHVRDSSLLLFMELADMEPVESPAHLPMRVVVPAFMVSELKTAFQMGFLLYLPFLVVDMVVATILMSMGMFMLPPMMVSMPFKLLLFIMFDGWVLLIRTLVTSFY